jgi:type IV secretory pathway VirB10-like protein
MRASVIVCIVVIVLIGLGLRARTGSSLQAPARVHAQERSEAKSQKPKNPKGPMPPPEADPPLPPVAPGDADPSKKTELPIHRESKSKSVEPPKVLWAKEVTGELRTTSQSARQAALEAAASALGDHLKERFRGFQWTPTTEFVNDLVVDEKEETVQLEVADAPLFVKSTVKVELRDSQLKAAVQENRKVRVESRLWQAVRGLGGLLIILVAIVGYVRLDDWTKGYLSFPLKLTALAVAVAGPITVWWLV